MRATAGRVTVAGHDVARDYRAARSAIGLVPQELTIDAFAKVADTVAYSRGLFRKGRDDAHIERVLRELSLFDKRDSMVMALSGGMKRRVMIAKALAHEPRILFLDEPTAGVDVELRRDMWAMIRRLRDTGVTVILTTHYIEEAEEMADRVGVIRRGEIILVEDKAALMRKLGRKQLTVQLRDPLAALPGELVPFDLERSPDGGSLTYSFDAQAAETGIAGLMRQLALLGLGIVTLHEPMVGLDVKAARLQRVLPDWVLREAPVFALMPSRLLPAKTRLFVDMLAARVTPELAASFGSAASPTNRRTQV